MIAEEATESMLMILMSALTVPAKSRASICQGLLAGEAITIVS